jgi:ketosteroid isomerase-like protein
MRRTLVVSTAATLVALTAVGGGGTAARAQQASDVDAVRAAAMNFYAALSARDIRAMEGLWSRDADPMMIHPTGPYARTPAVGWEAVRRSLETVFARFSEFSVSLRDPQVRVGEAGAVVVGVTPVRGRTPEGEVDYTALGTTVFERRGGRWLVVHHHASQAPQQ